MDKRALQSYATWSKQYLEQQIELSLKSLGIHSDNDIRDAQRVGDVTVIDGDDMSYPADVKEQRDSIISLIHSSGYQNTVEAFAYTWFNRIVALRFMEVHGFMSHGFRVLTDCSGGVEPEILKNLNLVSTELSLDMSICSDLKDKNDLDALFRYVLFKQCNALSKTLPVLFDMEDAYLELLLPKTLLKGDTVVTRIQEIPEDVFLDDVEVIGWLYQYYISSKKDKVFSDLKKNIKISSSNIPAATQLFTPDWIVRYMVENSLGRIWMESYPNSDLKELMMYYLSESEQDSDVLEDLQKARYRGINPETIRVLEPCCGSGHILVYLFDLLYKMYEEKGYLPREIPTLILSKNLYGLEIDKRASQLASFALVMRARSINNRFFEKDYYVRPQVFEIYDSKELIDMSYQTQLNETSLSAEEKREIVKLVELFADAKNIGSLTNVSGLDFSILDHSVEKLGSEIITTFNVNLLHNGCKLISKLIAQAKVMANKYDVCITNPPYLGSGGMNSNLSEYVKEYFPDSKSDLFACFIEKCKDYTKTNGFFSMITQHAWMFLSSYTKLREKMQQVIIVNMAHLGARAFDEIGGEIVQTTAFVNRCIANNLYKGTYVRLVENNGEADKRACFISGTNRYMATQKSYLSFPDMPIAYWVSDSLIKCYNNPLISTIAFSDGQILTGNNDVYLRFIWEVNSNQIKERMWALHAKGGEFRRWYGNIDTVVKFDPQTIQHYKTDKISRFPKDDILFRRGITWTLVSTNPNFGVRLLEDDTTFNKAAATILFNDDSKLLYVLGFLNSRVAQSLLRVINPTMNNNIKDVLNMPYIFDSEYNNDIEAIVDECVRISKEDWDSFEISWGFDEHPFVRLSKGLWDSTAIAASMQYYYGDLPHVNCPLELSYMLWQGECNERFNKLKENEEELNRRFIEIYDLQSELSPDVSDEIVTVRKADERRDIRSFISYLVGIVMGRYSLDVPGLTYAGGDWDHTKFRTYQPDDDGIVPVYIGVGMEDGLTGRILELIKIIFGEESFRANMDFIAEGLGKASNESSVETLNRYLNDGFYSDHLKIYQKRPIYWMFSSGKNKGFKCLVYMHRYNKDTLARINAKYYLPESTRQKIELEDLDNQIKVADGKERIRLEKSRTKFFDKYNETIEYGQVLDHMANKYIVIDLDDGVRVNYEKFQGVELVSDSGMKIKKDLLVPLK